MDFILAYVSNLLLNMLLLGLTLASSFVLLIMTKQFLKDESWITAHLSALLSILCLLPITWALYLYHTGFIGKNPNDAIIFAVIIFFLPVVAGITWLGLFCISNFIPQQYSYKEFPSFKIASALFGMCALWIFVHCLESADWSRQYAAYGTDMKQIMKIHAECGDSANCLGVEYAIMDNKNATRELITAIVEAKPSSAVACRAMRNPNVTKELILKWANYGWAYKRCADEVLNVTER